MIDSQQIQAIDDYIRRNWEKTIRFTPEDTGSILGMPYPYVVPCQKDGFQNIFYWDTYFTNSGLMQHGRLDLAKSNTDNLLYMVDKYGFMPNGNCDWYLNRSQAPFLAMMVYDVYQMTQDKAWLKSAVPILEKEYEFWMGKRGTANGLNRYFHHADAAGLDFFYEDVVIKRVAFFREHPPATQAEKRKIAGDYLAEAESGWDFNPRFDHRCGDFLPVDLNGYLFFYEQIMAHICDELSLLGADEWLKRATRRKSNFDWCCWNSKRGLFLDYDTVNERQSTVASLATFVPLWSRLASHEQADQVVANLPLF